ncbi:sperm protamine like protein [Tanacetum coccineum]|uniref:Sperm protamine like protein n=1 Tax=Tanacetum coccineum TaxID=301880 RepID=A0ABQ4X796_9ASTR
MRVWGNHEDVGRKVIVISSCLLEDIDYVTKIALLDTADKCVSVDFVLLEKVPGGHGSLSESINNFNRNICDLENCSFCNHLSDAKVLRALVREWLKDLRDEAAGSCHGYPLDEEDGNKLVNSTSCPVTCNELAVLDLIRNSLKVGEHSVLSQDLLKREPCFKKLISVSGKSGIEEMHDLSSTESGTWQAIESSKQRLLFKEIEHGAATARNFKETTRFHVFICGLDDLMVLPDCDKEMKMELEREDVVIRFIANLSTWRTKKQDASSDKKTSITIITQSKDLGADSMVISSPVAENVRSTMGLNVANEEELIRLGQATTKAQAAFRGYLVGHKERSNLLQTSLKSEKLSTKAFGSKQASVAAKNMKLLLMKEAKAICQLTSPIQLKPVSLGRNDAVAQLSLTAIIGLVPGLIISKDLFVGKTKKKLDVDSHVVH